MATPGFTCRSTRSCRAACAGRWDPRSDGALCGQQRTACLGIRRNRWLQESLPCQARFSESCDTRAARKRALPRSGATLRRGAARKRAPPLSGLLFAFKAATTEQAWSVIQATNPTTREGLWSHLEYLSQVGEETVAIDSVRRRKAVRSGGGLPGRYRGALPVTRRRLPPKGHVFPACGTCRTHCERLSTPNMGAIESA